MTGKGQLEMADQISTQTEEDFQNLMPISGMVDTLFSAAAVLHQCSATQKLISPHLA